MRAAPLSAGLKDHAIFVTVTDAAKSCGTRIDAARVFDVLTYAARLFHTVTNSGRFLPLRTSDGLPESAAPSPCSPYSTARHNPTNTHSRAAQQH